MNRRDPLTYITVAPETVPYVTTCGEGLTYVTSFWPMVLRVMNGEHGMTYAGFH